MRESSLVVLMGLQPEALDESVNGVRDIDVAATNPGAHLDQMLRLSRLDEERSAAVAGSGARVRRRFPCFPLQSLRDGQHGKNGSDSFSPASSAVAVRPEKVIG